MAKLSIIQREKKRAMLVLKYAQYSLLPTSPTVRGVAMNPVDYLGDVTGDLNRRRGIVLGMEDTVMGNIVKAEVPLSEMFGYSTSLRSMSQGRATYTMEFTKYAELPSNVAEALIQQAS